MARGSKNYFRHLVNAYLDPKIQRAIDEIGLEGYACFFIILEIVAEQCENEFKKEVTIHKRVVANALRKRSDSVHLVVTKLALSGLLSYHYDGTNFQLSIPNLSKYMGKYESKLYLNMPNKKKEKEIKVNIAKEQKKTEFDFEEVWNLYPVKKGKSTAQKLFKSSVKNKEDFELLKKAIENYKTEIIDKRTSKEFIKYGKTFFKDWRDYLTDDKDPLDQERENLIKQLEEKQNET